MELLELGKNPISDASPAGEDVRFEPEYEELESELGKLSSPTASGGIDWVKVTDLSQDILGKKSKNLTVACYLCIALLQKEGLNGFAAGVHVLKDLLENYWDTMFPPIKRMRGRLNAISWLLERIDTIMPGLITETWPKEKNETFVADLAAIDTFIRENTEDGPVLAGMNNRLASLIEIEPEKEPEPPPAEGAAATPEDQEEPESTKKPTAPVPAKAPDASTEPPSAEVSDVDAEKFLKQGLDILGKAVTLFMQQETLSIVPFRVNRIVAWLLVKNVPPATEGKTLIPPPDEQLIASLNSLYQSQNWRELLLTAEARIRQFLFWIDLSRYVAESLEQLRYPAISEVVEQETAGYVSRLSGIEKLAFSDGTPFADAETREWLKTVFKKKGGDGGGALSVSGSGVEQLVENELSVAHKLIKENKLSQALTGFSTKANQASSVHDRFIWKIGLARLLLRAKKPQLMMPYIQEILDMLDDFKIEQWEPFLAFDGLETVLSALRLQAENKDEELIKTIINRISAINPAKALELL